MHVQLQTDKTAALGHRSLRRERVSLAGQVYLLTATTLYHRPVFRDDEASRAVARAHSTRWLWRDSQLLAWVLMPDHWHAMVVLGRNDTLATLMGRFKSATARAVADRHRINGWLWSRGFHDRMLGSDDDVQATARHLVANPLRAHLVDHLGQYPYWDAVWLDAGNSSRLDVDERLRSAAPPREWSRQDSIKLAGGPRDFGEPTHSA